MPEISPSERIVTVNLEQLWLWRKRWLALLLVVAGILVIATWWLLGYRKPCQKLVVVLALLAFVVAGVAAFLYTLLARDDSLRDKIISFVVVPSSYILAYLVLASLASNAPWLEENLCESCLRAEDARRSREKGLLNAAEELARSCIDEAKDPECKASCGCELALIYYDLSETLIHDRRYQEAGHLLSEAGSLNSEYGCGLDGQIAERRERLALLEDIPLPFPPPPLPSPTPRVFELELAGKEPLFFEQTNRLIIDLKIAQDGIPVHGLAEEAFHIEIDGQAYPNLSIMEVKADDPSCIITVLDNSGSVRDGLEQIEAAVSLINGYQQSADELGMVIFAESSRVRVEQEPTSEFPLPTDRVDASGRYTALWDGVKIGIEQAQLCSSDNRYLIVVTDGEDNASQYMRGADQEVRASTLAREARQIGVRICTVGVAAAKGSPYLEILAERSGCEHFPADSFDDLASKISEILGGTREFYRIYVQGVSLTSGFHSLKVLVEASGLEVDFGHEP